MACVPLHRYSPVQDSAYGDVQHIQCMCRTGAETFCYNYSDTSVNEPLSVFVLKRTTTKYSQGTNDRDRHNVGCWTGKLL